MEQDESPKLFCHARSYHGCRKGSGAENLRVHDEIQSDEMQGKVDRERDSIFRGDEAEFAAEMNEQNTAKVGSQDLMTAACAWKRHWIVSTWGQNKVCFFWCDSAWHIRDKQVWQSVRTWRWLTMILAVGWLEKPWMPQCHLPWQEGFVALFTE